MSSLLQSNLVCLVMLFFSDSVRSCTAFGALAKFSNGMGKVVMRP